MSAACPFSDRSAAALVKMRSARPDLLPLPMLFPPPLPPWERRKVAILCIILGSQRASWGGRVPTADDDAGRCCTDDRS